MLLDGFLGLHPRFGTSFILAHYPTIEHRPTKATLQKCGTHAALTNLAPEDGAVLLLGPRLGIVYEHEVAELVKFLNHGILIISHQQAALDHGRHGRREIDVAGTERPPKLFGEPSGDIVLIEIVGRMKHLALVATQRTGIMEYTARMLNVVSGIYGPRRGEANVVIGPAEQLVVVGTTGSLFEFGLATQAVISIGHQQSGKVFHKIKKFIGLSAIQST